MIGWSTLFRAFGLIGLLSFGGPAAQIALMHRELVETRRWLTEAEFLRALSFCMLLPGPEAMQLATYAGWRLRGVKGGLLAGGLFVAPGAMVIAALALLYLSYGGLPVVAAAFLGIKAAVVAIVIEALLRVSRRALKSAGHFVLAGLAFVALAAFAVPFPVIVLAAGIWGFMTSKGTQNAPDLPAPPLSRLLRIFLAGGAIWAAPVLLTVAYDAPFLTDVGLFFSKLAVVTFGGAYAVLAYMTQEVVTGFGWLTTAQMIDALGLAETTPGPLILVTQFVAMVAGQSQGGTSVALLAGGLTLWVTFVPCFIWIFAGAPYVDWMASRPRLTGALAAITAAVVGVILNLSVWFALHVAFGTVNQMTWGPISLALPRWQSADPVAIALMALAAWLLFGRHFSLARVLILCAGAALATEFALGGI